MPDQPRGKNVVQIATCKNCGKRFQTRVQTNAGLCPDCDEALSFNRKPEPAPPAAGEPPQFGRAPSAAVTPHTPAPQRSIRRSVHRHRFVDTLAFKILFVLGFIAVAFGIVLVFFFLDANREASRVEALKEQQAAEAPAPATTENPTDPLLETTPPGEESPPAIPEPPVDEPPPEP